MIEKKIIAQQIPDTGIVSDLNNYLYEDKDSDGKVKIENIELLEDTLQEVGYSKKILIGSSSLITKVNKPKIYDQLVIERRICKAPALTDTDWYILKLAKIYNYDILSNDKFKDYWEEFGKDWIMEKRKTFMLLEGKLIIKL